jgi:hypothetical protein
MQTESQQRRRSMREIAEAIFLGEDLRKFRSESGEAKHSKAAEGGPVQDREKEGLA